MLKNGKLVSCIDENAQTLHEIFLRGMKVSGIVKQKQITLCSWWHVHDPFIPRYDLDDTYMILSYHVMILMTRAWSFHTTLWSWWHVH